MTIYDRSTREVACNLFETGMSYLATATRLGLPREALKKWSLTYRAVGRDALLDMGTKKKYDFETKVAAAKAVVEAHMSKPEAMKRFGIVSPSALNRCCQLYRESGVEALKPKSKGRPPKSASESVPKTYEEELERKVQKPEAQVAYLKNRLP